MTHFSGFWKLLRNGGRHTMPLLPRWKQATPLIKNNPGLAFLDQLGQEELWRGDILLPEVGGRVLSNS